MSKGFLIAGVIGFALFVAGPAGAVRTGRWSTPLNMGGTAINLMLMPGPDTTLTNFSRVIWWKDDHDFARTGLTNVGGRFVWTPFTDLTQDDATFQSNHLVPLALGSVGYNLFCSGANFMADSRLAVLGGTTEAENGERRGAIYDAVANTWDTLATRMKWGRWYPDVLTLPSGKLLITSGSQFRHNWLVGGSSGNDSLHRSPVAHGEPWAAAVLPEEDDGPTTDRLTSRRGHTANWSMGGTQVYFGGRLDDGSYSNEFWMLRRSENTTGADYNYHWQKRTPPTSLGPSVRAFAVAEAIQADQSPRNSETFLLFGGVNATGAVGDVWTGQLVALSYRIYWRQLTQSGTVPSARFGHAAMWHPTLQRFFIFGGAASSSSAPDDQSVYAMRFVDSTAVEWVKCTVENPDDAAAPAPRMSMANGVIERKPTATSELKKGMLLYGGRTSDNSVSDSLFVLWVIDGTTVRWQKVAQTGTHPALEYASGTATENTREFWVLGGKVSGDTTTAECRSFSSRAASFDALTAQWESRPSASHAVWGHTNTFAEGEVFTRYPEVYDPSTQTFTELPSPQVQEWYPQGFVRKGVTSAGQWRTYFPGPSIWDRQLVVNGSAGTWSNVATGPTTFKGGSSVMYRPNKVMKSGSRDTDGRGQTVLGRTATIDLDAGTPSWALSDSMMPRVNHNLVILPDGKVLVVGGMGHNDNSLNNFPRRCPEIWDPDANSGAGGWSGAGVLDSSTIYRGYHSSALLLPDGRVLCAGGNGTTNNSLVGSGYHNHQMMADIFSPPYLFNEDGTAANRPALDRVPRHVSYGEQIAVIVDTDTANVAKLALVRPGAVTHGFDLSQRYIPLTFSLVTSGSGKRRYSAAIPSDSTVVTPGEYLLFAVNAQGTPSIARWVRVRAANQDADHPAQVTDLHKTYCGGDWATLEWSHPASDSIAPASGHTAGRARSYEVRYKAGAMTTWAQFASGTLATSVPDPDDPTADPAHLTLTGLIVGLTYHVRLISSDWGSAQGNWSGMSNDLVFTAEAEEGGGTGGGGDDPGDILNRATQGGEEDRLEAAPTAPRFLENTLFANIPPGEVRTDRLLLPHGPVWDGETARVRVSRTGMGQVRIHDTRLVAVDHAEGEEVLPTAEGFITATRSPASQISTSESTDLTSLLASEGAIELPAGSVVDVGFGAATPWRLYLRSSGVKLLTDPEHTGIEVRASVGGQWVSAGRVHPRALASDAVVEILPASHVRLLFHGSHTLHGIGSLSPAPVAGTVTRFTAEAATNTAGEDVLAAVAAGGVDLAGSQHMLADFSPTPAAEGLERDWFLEVDGEYPMNSNRSGSARAGEAEAQEVPVRFALNSNQPNPFSSSTQLRFDLPVRSSVRVEVFDLAGRRVATLVDGFQPAGRHSLAWDGNDSRGMRASAGVYLCRMIAGEFTAQRHLVFVP